MIILRRKQFSRVSEFTDSWKLPISKEIREMFTEDDINCPRIIIETTSEYDTQFNEQRISFGQEIKKIRKSIRKGHLYDDGDLLDVNTHFIAEMSKKGKHQVFSKCIDGESGEHRLNYFIYPIELRYEERDDERIYYLVQKVVLSTCKGHKFYGKGLYSIPEYQEKLINRYL